MITKSFLTNQTKLGVKFVTVRLSVKNFYQSEKIKRVTRLIKSLAFHNSVQDHHYMPVSKVVDPLKAFVFKQTPLA